MPEGGLKPYLEQAGIGSAPRGVPVWPHQQAVAVCWQYRDLAQPRLRDGAQCLRTQEGPPRPQYRIQPDRLSIVAAVFGVGHPVSALKTWQQPSQWPRPASYAKRPP